MVILIAGKECKNITNRHHNDTKLEFSKILAIYLLVLLTAIVVFTMAAIWHFGDLSYINVLMSDIAAQILVYIIYCLKAYHGKKSEEELKLEKEKFANGNETNMDDGQI